MKFPEREAGKGVCAETARTLRNAVRTTTTWLRELGTLVDEAHKNTTDSIKAVK